MNIWVAATLAMIVASTAYSYYRQVSFSIVVSVICMLSFGLLAVSTGTLNFMNTETMYRLEFIPTDLTEPGRAYTVLTSMYTHAGMGHLLFNLLVIGFITMGFEQRIGTRPYMLLYFVAGFCGTLAFAGLHWGDSFIAVIGASGAISGVLGGYVRMFPNEKFTLIFPLPLSSIPLWMIVVGILLLQIMFLYGMQNIAVEAHVGGLIAGYVLAPYLVRLPLHKRVKKMVSQSALRKLATTPELKAIMRRIEDESISDVKSAWIEHYLSKAVCPHCGAKLKARKEGIMCERGHML